MLTRRYMIVLPVLPLVACGRDVPSSAVELPQLHLQPASLGREIAQQQQLHFTFGAHRRSLEGLLEVDRHEVRLLVQALGQSGARLRWDGHRLDEQRAPWLPSMVRSARVLDDVQFTLWPADAIRRVLPPGWTLEERNAERALVHGGTAWLVVFRDAAGVQHLVNRAGGYRLDIVSQDVGS